MFCDDLWSLDKAKRLIIDTTFSFADWILPNENGEVLGPNDLGFDAKYVIPIDAKFIGDQSIHTHRHKHTPGGGDSMDFYKYDKIDPTK